MLREELKADIASSRMDVKADIAMLREDVKVISNDLKVSQAATNQLLGKVSVLESVLPGSTRSSGG